jgi:hypothetical protein
MKRKPSTRKEEILRSLGALACGQREVYEVGVLLQYVMNARTIAETLSAIPEVDLNKALETASLDYACKNIMASSPISPPLG